MDLKSGHPFWPVYNGLPANFPPLLDDVSCDVVIAGAGITSALIAESLCEAGLDVVVLDKRDVGWGSTAASTALLQYEIDTPLTELVRLYGEQRAVSAYRACEKAVLSLGELASELGSVGFKTMQSLYFASRWMHAARVREEGELRQRHGFEVDVLDREKLLERSGIRASAALLTAVAAQVDPYRMTYALFRKLQRNGARIFDRSAMLRWVPEQKHISVEVERDITIRCGHLVIAAGYETQEFLPARVARNRSSYAVVTEPVTGTLKPLDNLLVWESARPYSYLRTTSDRRVLIGGEDDSIDVAVKRDALVARKSKRLMHKLRRLFPDKAFSESFGWAGTFAETADGLPFFGSHPKSDPRVHFAMAYGGNGITYSAIGAEIIRAGLTRRKHPLSRFFSFERLDRRFDAS